MALIVAPLMLIYGLSYMVQVVHAGHMLWEYAGGNNIWRQPQKDKRWMGMSPKFRRTWPDYEISYAFFDDLSESMLKVALPKAMESGWYGSQLPRSFKLTEVPRERLLHDRENTLAVIYRENGPTSSSLGRSLQGSSDNFPSLQVSNIVIHNPEILNHELGHAWGLLHEHQNKYFWEKKYGGFGSRNLFNFICENLADFQAMKENMEKEIANKVKQEMQGSTNEQISKEINERIHEKIYGEKGVCVNYRAAASIGFSAYDFLPFPADCIFSQSYETITDDLVDWDSLMLYNTYVNAAQSGGAFKPVIIRASDDHIIPPKVAASTKDVLGLLQLYGYAPGINLEALISEPSSPHYGTFHEMACGF